MKEGQFLAVADTGPHAIPLASRGYAVVGADTSVRLTASAVALARERRSRARFLATDPTGLPFAAHAFNAALAIKVCGFVPGHAQRVAWLSELARVLRPGAVLLLTSYFVPTEADVHDAFARADGHQHAVREFSSLEPLNTFIEGHGLFIGRGLSAGQLLLTMKRLA